MSAIVDPVITTDPQGTVRRMNPAAERATGWTSEEAVGRHLSTVFVVFDDATRVFAASPVDLCLGRATLVQTIEHLTQVARDGREFGIRWLFRDNQKLPGATATYRFMRTFSKGTDAAVLGWHLARAKDFLGIVEARVADRAFVLGERVTIVDFPMCAYLSYPEHETGFDLATTHPDVRAWLDRIAAVPGCGEVLTTCCPAPACPHSPDAHAHSSLSSVIGRSRTRLPHAL